MRYQQAIVCVLTALLSLAGGCATRSYAPTSDAGTRELKIKVGDDIRVATTRRERLAFEVKEVRADRFVGVTVAPKRKEYRPKGEVVEVPFDELAVIEITHFGAEKAALATAAVLLTVSAFAVLIGPAILIPAMPAAP